MKQMDSYLQTTGTVVKLELKSMEFPMRITVQYTVSGTDYTLTETVKLKSQAIKLLFLPIGQKKVPVMKEISVGSQTPVRYDPEDPAKAYLPENQGILNV